jgi:hypothetical protein
MQDPHKRRSAQHSGPGLAQSPVQERRRNLAVHDGPGALVAACRCSGGGPRLPAAAEWVARRDSIAFTLAKERACGADKGCMRPKDTKQQLASRRVAMVLLDTGWGARTQCR